ncbi:YggS family pyridoxal phosphate-dependent enzyme [Temperatibacter marinus]|uniref:Pyridoxal phosphate homeostasis protein n=1 Tax=Temperatibacter marinus TaxID=1456591 RepID=A0AA52EKE7_9PROT|nr:YggS family pyridoxal phosphate-dependent enzyme [Temperatibacter marinus]WND03641.1 YggS family pyridoxal phosphate-dependent enzyme [Temperatibacter marinus]
MASKLVEEIQKNIQTVRDKTASKIAYSLLNHSEPRLIAVSKVQPIEKIDAALEVGQRVFGENRVQEAEERWAPRREAYKDLTLILIGSLQTNKVSNAVALFDEIQSLDRIKLARSLKKEMTNQGKNIPLMIQVNTGCEEQKGGCLPQDLNALVAECEALDLNVVGLMCIPTAGEDPSLHFHLLKKLATIYGYEKLSMGMSGDYDLAAAMGSSDIRVGTAIFGARIST